MPWRGMLACDEWRVEIFGQPPLDSDKVWNVAIPCMSMGYFEED